MGRQKILLALTTIAALSTIYWATPPMITGSVPASCVCLLWGVLTLGAAALDGLENWAYRLSSFLGFMFLTVEGVMGLFTMIPKPYLLLVALLHGGAFILAVMGRWQKVSARRPRRSMDEALAEAKSQFESSAVESIPEPEPVAEGEPESGEPS